MLAAFPTIKFPDQNKVVKTNNKYAKLFLFVTYFFFLYFFIQTSANNKFGSIKIFDSFAFLNDL